MRKVKRRGTYRNYQIGSLYEANLVRSLEGAQHRADGTICVCVELKEGNTLPPEVDDGGGVYTELWLSKISDGKLFGIHDNPYKGIWCEVTIPISLIKSIHVSFKALN